MSNSFVTPKIVEVAGFWLPKYGSLKRHEHRWFVTVTYADRIKPLLDLLNYQESTPSAGESLQAPRATWLGH